MISEAVHSPLTIQSRGISLQYLPPPDQLQILWNPSGVCVICDNNSEEIQEVMKRLREHGWKIVLISLTSIKQKQGLKVPQYFVDAFDEITVKDLVQQITKEHGLIFAFIALGNNARAMDIVSLLGQETEKKYIDFIFLMATQLKASLCGGVETRTWFITANSIDGQFGQSENVEMKNVLSSGLSALTKTLQREWPQVFCRAIDFSPELSVTERSQLLIQELFDADRTVLEVGYTQNERYTLIPQETLEC